MGGCQSHFRAKTENLQTLQTGSRKGSVSVDFVFKERCRELRATTEEGVSAGGRREATRRHPECLGGEMRQLLETERRFDEKTSLQAKLYELFN